MYLAPVHPTMSPLSVISHSLRTLVPATFVLLGLAAASRALAITNDELLPASLVGKTLTCTYGAGTPNTLEATNNFTIQFTSASTYVRTSPILQTEGGTYSILDSSIAPATGNRATTIQINNNWLSPGSTTAILLVLTQQGGIGAYAASEFFNPLKNTGGLFTLSGSTGGGGGGTTVVRPSITSGTTASATVGVAYTYQIVAANSPTGYRITNQPSWLSVNANTGVVSGTPTAAGTINVNLTADNSAGSDTITLVLTVAASSSGGTLASYAGTYSGNILQRISGVTAILGGASYSTVISAAGGVVTTLTNAGSSSTLTGTINSVGTVAYTGGTGLNLYKITAGSVLIASSRPVFGSAFFIASTSSTGATTEYSLQSSTSFVAGSSGGGTTPTYAAAPSNLVGYRNKVGSVFQFAVTGASRGAVWGTDVYTDDSTVAVAAVHAGVLRSGETGTVTITILPGQSAYAASTRNGVSAASWGAWAGSYSFAGAGAVTGVPVATARPAVAPGFTAGTTSLAVGGRLVCPVNVIGGGTYTYRWYLNGTLISGATANPYIVESLTTANTGTYSVDVTNSLGTTRITAGTVTVGAAGSPVLALQPISKTVAPGATFTLATSASGSGLTYQWLRNGTPLAGETGAILLRQNVTAADAGNYSVRVSNSAGSVTSSAGTITLSADASRPANISVRTNVATGATVIPGFFVQGTGTKRVLIRAVGPGLAAFGLGGTMADPKFELFQGSTKIAENNDWTAANIGNAFAATGAFAIAAGSKDSALVTDLAAGKDYTVQVTHASGAGGIVLIEVYDADALKGTSTSKLVNVSVRGQTAPGDDILTLGVVIGGTGPRTLLVRGVGPKLAAFGVTGTVTDPSLQIFDSQQRAILANDDWSSADFVSELAMATNYVGAFALDAGSKDAATLTLVEPGAYTIQVSGTAASPTGEALVEVYEVP